MLRKKNDVKEISVTSFWTGQTRLAKWLPPWLFCALEILSYGLLPTVNLSVILKTRFLEYKYSKAALNEMLMLCIHPIDTQSSANWPKMNRNPTFMWIEPQMLIVSTCAKESIFPRKEGWIWLNCCIRMFSKSSLPEESMLLKRSIDFRPPPLRQVWRVSGFQLIQLHDSLRTFFFFLQITLNDWTI